MRLADHLDEIECEECRKLAIEDTVEFVTDSEKLARLRSRSRLGNAGISYIRELLGRPQDSLEQLARALAIKAKESGGVYKQ
jgi:hypothetical protein